MEEEKSLKDQAVDQAKALLKDQIKKKIWIYFLPLIPYFLVAVFGVLFMATLLLPLMGFFGNPTGSDDDPLTAAEQSFVDTLKEREDYWLDKNVVIDKDLILATIFFEEPFGDDDLDCLDPEAADCEYSTRNYTALAKEVPVLADNMVDSKTIYYCSAKTETEKMICEEDDLGMPVLNCYSETVTTWEEPVACGSDSKLCATTCGTGYKETSEVIYFLKDQVEYIAWLKSDFLIDKLKGLDYPIPNDETEKNELLDETIEKIFSMKATVSEDDGFGSVFGSPMYGFGEAGPIPEVVLKNLLSPLGTQSCRQTACYGNYNLNNCSSHNGVDIGNNGGMPLLYSVFSGKIISISRGSGNCKPNFEAEPKCPSGCSSNIVLIEHQIYVDGVPQVVYSKYVHLASFASGITVGAQVSAGQLIGVMGNTGCSDAVHLHFELWNAARERYNPEELLNSTGCSLRSDCSAARLKCGS